MICYEDVFSAETVDEVHRPAWLLNITDDAWFGDSAGPRQHFADARLRAVEAGLPLVRDANSGVSAVFDPLGRVMSSLPMNVQGVLLARLPAPLPPTLYAKYGLWIPFLAAISVIAGGIWLSGRHQTA